MIRATVCAAALALVVGLAAPAPAQAAMANPGLATAAPSMVQDAAWYWRGRYWRHRHWRCWYVRVRVRVRHHWEWRTVRRCAWRYW
jgi:hypothetical protein